MRPSFPDLVRADLLACTGRRGWRALLSAWVFEAGFAAVLAHRCAQWLYGAGFERTAKLLWRRNVRVTSCQLHLDAEIGPGLHLPHPLGVVVGAGSRVGAGVTLYQHTTIGRSRREERYPQVGDGVIVYPGAVIAGPVTVGAGAVVGANAVVRRDVPAGAIVAAPEAQAIG